MRSILSSLGLTVAATNKSSNDYTRNEWDDEARVILYRSRTQHVVMIAAMVAAGIAIALWIKPDEWAMARSIAAGALGGFAAYYCLFINWILVADWG